MNDKIFSFYLAGPIWNDKIDNKEISWRNILTRELEKRNQLVIDPTLKKNDEFEGENVAEVVKYRNSYGFEGEKTKKLIDWIFYEDLSMIDKSDAVIAFLPKKVSSFGTAQELFYNFYVLKRQNFIITNMNLITDTSVFLQKTTGQFFSSISNFIDNFDDVISKIT